MNKIENLESSSKKENTTKESEQRKVKIEVSKGHKVFQDIDGPREIIVKCSCDDPMYINLSIQCRVHAHIVRIIHKRQAKVLGSVSTLKIKFHIIVQK